MCFSTVSVTTSVRPAQCLIAAGKLPVVNGCVILLWQEEDEMWKMSPSVFLHTMEEGNSVYKGQFTRTGVLTGVPLLGRHWCPVMRGFCCLLAQSCLTLCLPVDCSTSNCPVRHCLPEFAQTREAANMQSTTKSVCPSLF